MRLLQSILAAALVVLMIGLPACGGEDAVATHPAPQPGDASGLPNATVAAIRVCASRAEHRKGDVYTFQFDVEVTESGNVDRVRLKDSYPRNTALESCLASAIERMHIPPFAVQKVLEQAGTVSPESRGLIGNPLLLVALLLESTVVVDEATFMVALSVAAAHDVVEAIKRRNRRRDKCHGMFVTCQDDRPSSCTRIIQGRTTLCEICRERCQAKQPYEPFNECYQCGFGDLP
jgi:hypothetical protein